jgi:HEAT repeat protein
MTAVAFWLAQLTGGDDARAEKAAIELASLGLAALDALRQLANSTLPDQRWWALRTLTEISHPQVPDLLAKALHDPELSVRQCAALGLRRQPNFRAIADLIPLLDASDSLIAGLAADALIAVGTPAVEPLLAVMAGEQPQARMLAAKALALIGDLRAIPALFYALDEDSALLEYWASEGLDRMGIGMAFFKP